MNLLPPGGVSPDAGADDAHIAAILALAKDLEPVAVSLLLSRLASQLAHTLTARQTALALGPTTASDAMPEEPPIPHPQPQPKGTTFEAIDVGRDLISPNGIDPTIGGPRYRLDLAGTRRVAAANRWDKDHPDRRLHKAAAERDDPKLGMVHGFSYDTLAIMQKGAGWGLVVPANEDTAILKALSPLIVKRCEDQGITPPSLTFQQGETCGAWLRRVGGDASMNRPMDPSRPIPIFLCNDQMDAGVSQWCQRHNVDVDSVDPRRGVPYYLLLVGRPGARFVGDPHIPFSFQYDLDFHWGVGRIGFTDARGDHRYEAYAAYAEQLVAVERGQRPPRSRSIAYLATRHDRDPSTIISSDELVTPLLRGIDAHESLGKRFAFESADLTGTRATRHALEQLLIGATGRPAILFSATHGIDLPFGHRDQIMQQGAFICQDWDRSEPLLREHWLAGEDLPMSTDVEGMVAVCFACFGVGCPAQDQFHFDAKMPPYTITSHPFLAQLPQRLLERGAIAVLGHVDRAWSYSVGGVHAPPGQTQAFEDVLGRMMDGQRLGKATDQFNTRQGKAAMRLTDWLDKFHNAPPGAPLGLKDIGPAWAAFSDARGYVLLGDPAARIHAEAAAPV